jgi:SAM-dependent methyltransferase
MQYKYFSKNNYEDFSSGRIILHKLNYPNFPVRLAGEIFCQCSEYIRKTKELCVYDPCCGSGYLLTILGFLFNDKIKTIYGSDINEEAIIFTQKNHTNLSTTGLEKRKNDILDLINKQNKQSHKDALNSLNNISKYIKHDIKINTFIADILKEDELKSRAFCADIVITDIPYGNLVSWNTELNHPVNILLDTIIPIINKDTIIAVIYDKSQKINNSKYTRLRKYKVGHRIIEIMKLG